MSGTFQLEAQEFLALNGGPPFKFTEAISFFIDCDSREDVDELWEKRSEGGETDQRGWRKDNFGLSWQVIPSVPGEILQDEDPERPNRVMLAMLQMTTIDIAKLKQAYDQAWLDKTVPAQARENWATNFKTSQEGDEGRRFPKGTAEPEGPRDDVPCERGSLA